MADYIDLNLLSDPTEVEQFVYSYIQDWYPTWEPREGQLEVIQTEAFAELIVQLRDLVNNVPPAIFRYFGTLFNINPIDDVAATGTVTIAAIDTTGHVIPAGTQMYFNVDEDTRIGFETVADATILAGTNSVAGVTIRARAGEEGTIGNNLSSQPVLVNRLDYINTITVTAATAGGTDGESDEEYQVRLSDRLQLLADRPVLAVDVATYVRTAVVGISRAVAFDNVNVVGGVPVAGVEKAVTFAAIHEDGTAATTTEKNAALALLNASRETGFLFNAIDPTYNPINMHVTVHKDSDSDAATVQAAVLGAINSFLNPALHGQPAQGETREWINTPVLRLNKVIQMIENVEGVQYTDNPTMAINPAAFAAADINMVGQAPLPQPGPDIVVTVV